MNDLIPPQTLRARIDHVRQNIEDALQRSGRVGERVRLLVASKYYCPQQISVLRQAGVTLVGENRLQDLVQKQSLLAEDLEWHFIGHLQRRKVKDVLPRVTLIQSVDSPKLLREIQKRAPEHGSDVLLQVNVSEEPQKYGIPVREIEPLLEIAAEGGVVRVRGLMTIAPLVEDGEKVRYVFAKLRAVRERLVDKWGSFFDMDELSMGMSNDYRVAVEEGATIVRVGRALIEEGEPAGGSN